MLSIVIFLPLLFSLLLIPIKRAGTVRAVSLIFSIFYFLFSLLLFYFFNPNIEDLQLVEKIEWFSLLGAQYFVAIDGLSFWFVILTAFLSPISVLASWNLIKEKVRGFHICIFLMMASIMGTFLSLDGVLFYMFFESSLVPLYFIIGIWGGKQRAYAAMKFFIYTGFGSLFLLAGIAAFMHLVWQSTGQISASIVDFYSVTPLFIRSNWLNQQNILFFCFFIPFAIKLPMVPFHTWLPLAHVEAPAPGSAWLAAVILKMGAYGFLRFIFPLFPQSAEFFAPFICWLGAFSIIYGAFMALAQINIKKLVAYSSISHMGYILLGLFSWNIYGLTGAFYQSLTHALSSAGLFLMVGMLQERTRNLNISEYGGAAIRMPILACYFVIISLSAIALPGTGGFISEFFVLIGAFSAGQWESLIIVVAAIVITAAVMLYLIHRIFFGEPKACTQKLSSLSIREKYLLVPFVVLVFVTGLLPNIFLKYSSKSLDCLIKGQDQCALNIYMPDSTQGVVNE